MPGLQSVLVFRRWGFHDRSHLIHGKAGFSGADPDPELADPEHFAFAALIILLNDEILSEKRDRRHPESEQSRATQRGRRHSFVICFNHIGPANQQFRFSMINILRKNQRVLMLVIAVLTIIAFIWLYNPANTAELGANRVATIYGRTLSQADIEREVKSFQLALALGQFRLLENLGAMTQDENRALEQFIWHRLVMQHQAKELGIEPTDSQIAYQIKSLLALQTDGQFDSGKYKTFVLEQLGPRGFTELQLENLIRDALRFERVKAIVSAPVAVSEAEILDAARL